MWLIKNIKYPHDLELWLMCYFTIIFPFMLNHNFTQKG